MAIKKFRILEITLRLRYKVYEDFLCHLKTSFQELIQKHVRIVKTKPIEFLRNMVSKGVPIETNARYKDYEDTVLLVNPLPCLKCRNANVTVNLDTDDIGRECLHYNGKYWVDEMPAPFVVRCKCGNRGGIGYSYEECVIKWNELQKAT